MTEIKKFELETKEANDVCRLLDMMTRLSAGSYPSALDKATAQHLYRRLRAQC